MDYLTDPLTSRWVKDAIHRVTTNGSSVSKTFVKQSEIYPGELDWSKTLNLTLINREGVIILFDGYRSSVVEVQS
jgi:hypothetical protein